MKIIKTLPGIGLSLAIAVLALWVESLLPIHIIGASVIAMFIGMTLNYFLSKTDIFWQRDWHYYLLLWYSL